ncbi:inducible metalloproteinase inhibitor protein-like isoform X2 [Pararge aegeria]|uniref:inducible metalloproteinase inhibitor protein-like isoform X2 n=1 Tax=Pararge aegeria TaxID=116150 RepID=UPI0019D2EC35|nr:inducible metalloproteinase inhibitor protein-like isoform X2 [Pararge aegeria]
MRNVVLSVSFLVFLLASQSFGTLQCSRLNEIRECVRECPPEKSCKNKDIKFSCLHDDKKSCQLKCVCKEGFYRNYDGDCVSNQACDRCPALNEVFNCGSACDTTCATLNQRCPILNIKCNEKCYCRRGYARNDKDICIPISECTRSANEHEYDSNYSICGPNEEYQKCKTACPPDTCISLVAKYKCVSNPPCVPGCVCKSSFLRAKPNSPCIPMRQCQELAN